MGGYGGGHGGGYGGGAHGMHDPYDDEEDLISDFDVELDDDLDDELMPAPGWGPRGRRGAHGGHGGRGGLGGHGGPRAAGLRGPREPHQGGRNPHGQQYGPWHEIIFDVMGFVDCQGERGCHSGGACDNEYREQLLDHADIHGWTGPPDPCILRQWLRPFHGELRARAIQGANDLGVHVNTVEEYRAWAASVRAGERCNAAAPGRNHRHPGGTQGHQGGRIQEEGATWAMGSEAQDTLLFPAAVLRLFVWKT